MESLTKGQKRLREIVKKYNQEYLETSRSDKDNFLNKIADIILNDAIIQNDLCTNQDLTCPFYADEYVTFIYRNSRDVPCEKQEFPMNASYFIYTRRDELKKNIEAYKGGVKPPSFIETLFGIENDENFLSDPRVADMVYYPKHQLVKPSSGGNHRLLAQYLYGVKKFKANRITVYEESLEPDLELNEAVKFLTKRYGLFAFDEYSINEANQTKTFVRNHKPIYRIFVKFISFHRDKNPRYSIRDLTEVMKRINQLQQKIRSEKRKNRLRRIKKILNADRVPYLEDTYLNCVLSYFRYKSFLKKYMRRIRSYM